MAEADLAQRWVVSFLQPVQTSLVPSDLPGTALKALGLNNDICAGGDYTVSQQWARAIHEADGCWDGIRYVSRQNNTACCYAIFERCGVVKDSAIRLEGEQLEQLCDRFGVVAL